MNGILFQGLQIKLLK